MKTSACWKPRDWGRFGSPNSKMGKSARTMRLHKSPPKWVAVSLEIRLAAGGRANLFATEDCCLLVDDDLLRQINCTGSMVISTMPNFAFARGSACCDSEEHSVRGGVGAARNGHQHFEGARSDSAGPRGAPPEVAVLYTDPLHGERARQLFEPIVRQRLERLGLSPPMRSR